MRSVGLSLTVVGMIIVQYTNTDVLFKICTSVHTLEGGTVVYLFHNSVEIVYSHSNIALVQSFTGCSF